ncbi:MAG: hypothetical protein ACRENG_19480 [bacterium]
MNHKTAGILATLIAAAMIAGCSEDNSPVQPQPTGPQATVIAATGDITAKVNEFRALLGDPNNGGQAGQKPNGRREVGWDGAGAKPFNNRNDFPATFFNTNAKNGIVFTTNGTGFRNDSLLFAEINPTYGQQFKAFSQPVTFSAIGSNIINALPQVAGEPTPAIVIGFGVVFSDVDRVNKTSLELFDKNGSSLGVYYAPVRSDANGLSFVGVKYDAVVVARVKITCGDGALGAGVNDVTSGGTVDVVVVDNLFYGEPQAF